MISIVGHATIFHVKIDRGKKFTVRSGVGDDGCPAGVLNHAGHRYTVVSVSAQYHVDPGNTHSQFKVDVHAVVRKQYGNLRAFIAHLVDHRLKARFIDTKFPVWGELRAVGLGRVGKRLTDDGNRDAVLFADDIRIKHRVCVVLAHDVLGNEGDLVLEIIAHDMQDALGTVGKFPMPSHYVDAQLKRSLHHVLSRRPQCGGRALPTVSSIQQQSVRTACFQALDQTCEMRETADLAVGSGRSTKIEMGKRVGLPTAGPNSVCVQQRYADQMRHFTLSAAYAEVNAGFAIINGQQLGVTIGEMQKTDVTKSGDIVELVCA